MKLVSYLEQGHEQLGIFFNSKIYNLQKNALILSKTMLPDTMYEFLKLGNEGMKLAKQLDEEIKKQSDVVSGVPDKLISADEDALLAPVPHPTSCRDGYAFRQHVEAARRNRKVAMIPEFDQYP